MSYEWRSANYAARLCGRTSRQIKNWCINGFLAKRGVPVYQDKSKRWWVAVGENSFKTLMKSGNDFTLNH